VLTTPELDGNGVHGMTANGVASVSLDPPLILAVVGHERNSFPLLAANRRFGISVLTIDQQGVARHFTVPDKIRATLPPPPTERLGESTVIAGALAAMDCRVTKAFEAGDHTIFIAEVEHIKVDDGDPLVFYQSLFVELAR
jgi:flavin reductase (DIM6/NTAB) family NADH-FMN oxidoreductase RutF